MKERLVRRLVCLCPSVLILLATVCQLNAQEEPEFVGITRLADNEIRLTWDAPTDQLCRVDAATDLPDWSGFLTVISTGRNEHADSAAPFLRARWCRAVLETDPNAITGDHLVTDDGEVIIHPVEHATFVMRWNTVMVYCDPVGGATPFDGLPRADLILLTHGHSDHLSTATIDAVKSSGAVIIAAQSVYQALPASLQAITTTMTNGSSTSALGIAVDAVPMYNVSAPYHPQGDGNGYVLTIAGRRIYISGDTDDIAQMRALAGIDVAFVCMRPPYTMGVPEAADAVREFRPKVVYPYPYKDNDVALFKLLVGTASGVEVRLRDWY